MFYLLLIQFVKYSSDRCTRKKNKMKNVNMLKRNRPYQQNLEVSIHKTALKSVKIINIVFKLFLHEKLFLLIILYNIFLFYIILLVKYTIFTTANLFYLYIIIYIS